MTPETAVFLAAAAGALSDAGIILAANVPRQAARLAYYAQFHAAQALIFERTGKISKTHKGVNHQFHMLVKTEPSLSADLAMQLAKAYIYKERADYHTDMTNPVPPALAAQAIVTAERFVAVIRQALTP